MAAYTSTQNGDWSLSSTWGGSGRPANGDTVTIANGHTVTVTADTTVGTSGSTGTAAITISDGAHLVITGSTLTLHGDIQSTAGSNSGTRRDYLTINPNETAPSGIEFDPPSGARYRIDLPIDSALKVNGTSAGRCFVRTKVGATGYNGHFYGPGSYRMGQIIAAYCDFTRLGDATKAALNDCELNWPTVAWSMDHCTWDTCGSITATFSGDGTFSLVDSTWINCQGNYALTLGISAARNGNATTRQVVRCSFDKLVYANWRDFTITDSYMKGWVGTSASGWTEFSGGVIHGVVANDAVFLAGGLKDVYLIQDPGGGADDNPHFVSTWTGGDSTLDGCIAEYVGTSASGDVVTGLGYGASSTVHITIRRCITLPNAAGDDSGTPFTMPSSALVALTAEHNTWFIGSQAATYGEPSGTLPAGSIASFRGNILWDTSPRGYKLWNAGALATGGTSDVVSPGNADYNVSYNVHAANPSAYPGNAHAHAGRGYQGAFSAVPGAHDLDGTSPAFFWQVMNHSRPGLAAWDASLGGPGTVVAATARLVANPALARSSLLPFVRAEMRPTASALAAFYNNTQSFPGDSTTTDAAGNAMAGTVGAMAYVNTGSHRSFAQAKAIWDTWVAGTASGQTIGAHYLGNTFASPSRLGNLDGDLHYDVLGVYIDAKEYVGGSGWDRDIAAARYQVRDQYFWPNGGASVSSYHRFTDGLRKDWERSGEVDSRDIAILSSYGGYGLPIIDGGYDLTGVWGRSRECALSLLAGMHAERCGRTHQARTDQLASYAMSHIDVWVSDPTNAMNSCIAVQPFMCGITLYALTAYHDYYRTSTNSTIATNVAAIPGKVKTMIDYLRAHAWFADALAWPYWDRDTTPMHGNGSCTAGDYDAFGVPAQPIPCPFMNSLIGHAYAWYALQSGDRTYLQQYEESFIGSTMAGRGGDLTTYPAATTVHYDDITISSQKQWNQSTLFEFRALKWRDQILNPWPEATAYTLTTPAITTGQANRPSDRFTVALSGGNVTLTTPVTITPSDGLAHGRFLPPSVILTTDEPFAVFRYIPAEADVGNTVTISVINSGSLIDPTSAHYTVSGVATVATGYTVTPPVTAHGPNEYSPDWTVALFPAGSVPPPAADADGGLVLIKFGLYNYVANPGYWAWLSADRTSATFQIYPEGHATATIAFYNNCGFTNPSNVTYTTGPNTGNDYTLTAPATGSVGTPVVANVSLTMLDPSTKGTVTFTPSDVGGGGSWSPGTATLWAKQRSAVVNYIPGAPGVKKLSATTSPILNDPSFITLTVINGSRSSAAMILGM